MNNKEKFDYIVKVLRTIGTLEAELLPDEVGMDAERYLNDLVDKDKLE